MFLNILSTRPVNLRDVIFAALAILYHRFPTDVSEMPNSLTAQ